MAQIGAGSGSHFPQAIDTKQIFQNGVNPAPDSDTRVDAEVINDSLTAIVNIETTLGANPQGNFASVAARLDFHFPDDAPPAPTNLVPFINQTVVTVPATQHLLNTAQILWGLWDASTPRQALEPGSLSVNTTTYEVVLTFPAPQSGTLVLDAPPTRFAVTYTNAAAFTVLGTTHGLGTADLFWALYTATNPAEIVQPDLVTIHPTTFDVVVSFQPGTLQSGVLVLSPGRTHFAQSFTNQTTVTIPGATHGLGTAEVLYQLYDAATPRNSLPPGSLQIDPSTFAVVLSFAAPQSGRLLLSTAQAPAMALMAAQATARRVGPIDPLPMLLRTVQAMEARIQHLEAQQLALVTQVTPPPPEETRAC
jgi:hypothetical protein